MKRLLKWIGIGVLALGGLCVLAVGVIYAVAGAKISETYEIEQVRLALDLPEPSPEVLAHGEHLAKILGCASGCHGPSMAGQVFIDIPNVAKLIAPNLTLLGRTYPVDDLVRSIRFGVKPDGTSVFGMPSADFHHLTDPDLAALIAYLRSRPIEPDGTDQTQSIRLMGRFAIATGEFPLAAAQIRDGAGPRPAPDRSNPVDHGRYLARVACAECHGSDLQGLPYFPSPSLAIVRAYGRDDFAALMADGTALGDREVGLMSEVARARFSGFTESEVDALYAYLGQLGGPAADRD